MRVLNPSDAGEEHEGRQQCPITALLPALGVRGRPPAGSPPDASPPGAVSLSKGEMNLFTDPHRAQPCISINRKLKLQANPAFDFLSRPRRLES